MNLPEAPFSLSVRLVRFEDRFAVLSHESLGEFRWPVKNLPDNLKIGDSVTLKIATPSGEEEEKYVRMRRLLEELIN